MATDSTQQAPARTTAPCGAYIYETEPGTDRKVRFTCRLERNHSPSNIHRDGITIYWDDRDTETTFPSLPELCALCGKHDTSFVSVRDGNNLVADRLCVSHTLREIIMSRKFTLQVELAPARLRARIIDANARIKMHAFEHE